ncbi:MAG: TSUP family transporter [Beijerinckiaceae bacterium]
MLTRPAYLKRADVTELDLYTIAALFLVAVIAGCFDAIAGGGGLLTLPAMMLAGLDPIIALATNKLQSTAGTLSATHAFARKGLIDWRIAWPMAIAAFCAAILGALCINLLPRAVVSGIVPFMLITIALYFGFGPKMEDGDRQAKISIGLFTILMVPLIGFYDGVFGPGAGSFYMAAFVGLLGFGVVKATAHTKLANAASSMGGLCFFAATGAIYWSLGLVMAVGAFAGAQIGSVLAMRVGAKLIRPLLVTICCLMAVRLMSDPANPARRTLSALGAFINRLVAGG